jgi:cell division protein FtsB
MINWFTTSRTLLKQVGWENRHLEDQVEELKEINSKLKESRDRVNRRMKDIEERMTDILKLCFASDFTRKDIMSMDPDEFAFHETQIDKDLQDGKMFLDG